MKRAELPPVGPSTLAVWITSVALAVVGVLEAQGTSSTILLCVSAGLVAANNLARSYQSQFYPAEYVVDEGPVDIVDFDDIEED